MTLKSLLPGGKPIIKEFKINNKRLKQNIMKKWSLYSLTVLSLLTLTSCEAVETIFKAGMWWGIIVVVGIVGIILWLFSRGRK